MANNNLDADFFKGNRQRLRELANGLVGPIIITSAGRLQQSAHQAYEFFQDRYFWYLTGLDEANAILVIDGSDEYLILPSRSNYLDIFEGKIDKAKLSFMSGINDIHSYEDGWQKLTDCYSNSTKIGSLLPMLDYIEDDQLYSNPSRRVLIDKLRQINDKFELVDLRPILAKMRMIKQPAEIAAIRRAIQITLETISDIEHAKKDFRFENEIEAEVLAGVRRRGAEGQAFYPVVASGERACTLHYNDNNQALSDKDLIVLDIGARFNHYVADITRTIKFGDFSDRQLEIYNAVKEVQNYAISLLRPGVMMSEYENDVRDFMGRKLIELGLKGDTKKYYPHLTSHFIGLDAHDVGNYDEPLAVGSVVTVEPGIYIAEEGIGVRIEDDILITDSGNEVLSKPNDHA